MPRSLVAVLAAVVLAGGAATAAAAVSHDDPAAVGHIDTAIAELEQAKSDLEAPAPTVTVEVPGPTVTVTVEPPAPEPPVAPEPEPAPPVVEPTVGVQPNAANTGPRLDSLTPSGGMTITNDGAVISGRDISGVVTVRADNVTIVDSRIRASTNAFVVNLVSGFTGLTVDHVEVEAITQQANAMVGGAGVTNTDVPGANITVRWSELSGFGDGAKIVNGGLYEYNYVHTTRPAGTAKHTDGMQDSGSSNAIVRFNNIDQGAFTAGDNSAVFVQAYTGSYNKIVENVTVHDNWLTGGVYTVHTGDGKTSSTGADQCETGCLRNVAVYDNRFYPGAKYGYFHVEQGVVDLAGHTFGGWDGDGAPVRTGSIF